MPQPTYSHTRIPSPITTASAAATKTKYPNQILFTALKNNGPLAPKRRKACLSEATPPRAGPEIRTGGMKPDAPPQARTRLRACAAPWKREHREWRAEPADRQVDKGASATRMLPHPASPERP